MGVGADNRLVPAMMTTRETADRLGVSVRTVIDLIHAGTLPAYRIRHQWRVKRVELERWIVERGSSPLE